MMAAGGPARGAGQWPTPGWHIAADRPEWEVRVMPGGCHRGGGIEVVS